MQENREKLISIIKTIILCGRQNLALRSHRDDGPIDCNILPTKNDGNFRALLRFCVDAGDKVLENHLQNPSLRKKYTSKTIQNESIECCRLEILDIILKRISKAKYYSIAFDETPDLAGRAQVSLNLRYIDEDFNLREEFIGFIDAFGELKSYFKEGNPGKRFGK